LPFVLEEDLDVLQLAINDGLEVVIDAGDQFAIVILKSCQYRMLYETLPI
jgi:hypothetical protein